MSKFIIDFILFFIVYQIGFYVGKKYAVGIDFDGVLHSFKSPWKDYHIIEDEPVVGAMEWLTEIMKEFNVVIYTTRGKTWRGRRAVKKWLNEWRPEKDGNKFEVTALKPPALVYVDDRAWRFNGKNYPTVQEVHKAIPWNKLKNWGD